MCKISHRKVLFKHWLWRLTSQNYSHDWTSYHEHQQEQIYSSAVTECRFAVFYSPPLTWVWFALPVLVKWGSAKWAGAQECFRPQEGVWLLELQEPKPVSGHCPDKGQVAERLCQSPAPLQLYPQSVTASTELGSNCPWSAASRLVVWPLLREWNPILFRPLGLDWDRTS